MHLYTLFSTKLILNESFGGFVCAVQYYIKYISSLNYQLLSQFNFTIHGSDFLKK